MRRLLLLTAVLAAACAGPPMVAPEPPAIPPPSRPAPAPSTQAPPAGLPDPGWASVPVTVMPAPPWEATLLDSLARPAVIVPRLSRLTETPNTITDEEAWLQRHDLTRPGADHPSRPLPTLFRDEPLARVIEQTGWTLGIYGVGGSGRYLLIAGEDSFRRAFDFAAFWSAPTPEGAGWPQDLLWASIAGERLYVAHAHPTYAATTGGLNGYLTALDLDDGHLLWRSRPLVANARTFQVVDDAIIAGYGFTAEPDFLYVLDRFNGRVLSESRVRTAPTWIVRRGRQLLVRAYDADYTYALL